MNLLVLLFGPIIKSLKGIEDKLDALIKKVDHLMGLVSIQQSDLDDIAETVSEVADSLQEVLDSDTPTPPADETAIRAAVEKLQAVGPKVEQAPTEEPPVEKQP